MTAPLEGRARAIQDILAWDAGHDPFWTLPQVQASRRAWLTDLKDDALREEWRWYKARYGSPPTEADK